jgi:hypothetical protein
MLCAWEMLLPKRGPLPQMSQVCAIVELQISLVFSGAALAATTLTAPRAIALPNLQYISIGGGHRASVVGYFEP